MRPDYRCARLLLLIANLAFPGAIAHGADAGTAAADASSAPTIVFVCEHGSSRSLVAATLFNRIAEQRGLAVRAISRAVSATTVDTKVPPRLVQSMSGDGFDVETFQPQAMTPAEAARASRVVVINYHGALEAAGQRSVDHWDEIAPASIEYDKAKHALSAQIESLFGNLEPPAAVPGSK